jgi:hypothetical protein
MEVRSELDTLDSAVLDAGVGGGVVVELRGLGRPCPQEPCRTERWF